MATRVSKEPSTENPEEVYENFLQKSLGELKDYLSLRGLSVTGKKRELVARALSEGPVNSVDLLVVEVAVTLLYSNRRLFLGDLVLVCSKGVRKRVGNGLTLVGFPSWKWFERTTTLSLDFPIAKSFLPFWTCRDHASIIWLLGLWNDSLPTCEWISHFSGYLRSLSQPPTQHLSPNPISPTKFMYGKYNAF